MPVVPYRSKLAPGAAPAVQQNINVPTANPIGQSLSGLAQMADKHYAKVDETNAQKVLNGYRQDANELRARFLEKSGDDAFNGIKAYKTSLGELRDKHVVGAANGRQQHMLGAAMDSADLAYNDAGFSHAVKELTAWNNKEAGAAIELHVEDALFNRGDLAKSKNYVRLAEVQMRSLADTNGAGKEATDAAVLKMTTQAHESIITTFVAEKDFEGARAHFEDKSNRAGISEQKQAELGELLDKGELLSDQQTTFDILKAEHGDDYVGMLEAASKTEKGELRKGVEQLTKAYISTQTSMNQVRERQAKIEVFDHINGGGDPDAILQNPEWSKYYSTSDINKMKSDQMKANDFGTNSEEGRNEYLAIQFAVDAFSDMGEREAYLNSLEPIKLTSGWHNNHRQDFMNFMTGQRELIVTGKNKLANPKEAMLQTTRQAVANIFAANGPKLRGKGPTAKAEHQGLLNLYNDVISQYADEELYQKDTVAFRENVKKIAATLLLEDGDYFGNKGYLFQNIDAIETDEEVAAEFFEDLPADVIREVMEAAGPNSSAIRMMSVYLRANGVTR